MKNKITDIKKILFHTRKDYLIANSLDLSEEEFIDKVAYYLKSGIKILHFIPDNLNDTKTVELSLKLRQLTSLFDAIFLIEQRLDIAKIANADGICLKENNLNPKYVKQILDDEKIICMHISDSYNANRELLNDTDIILFNFQNKRLLKDTIDASIQFNKTIFVFENKFSENFIKAIKHENNI